MTSNQIAFASVQESERHNKVSEDLSREANDIARQKNEITDQYNKAMAAIQQEYNDKYLAMMQAQGDEKLRLEGELNSIKDKQANTDNYYKTELLVLQEDENRIKRETNAETNRHNVQFEGLENKRVEYEKAQWNVENALGWSNLQLATNRWSTEATRVSNEFTLGLYSAQAKLYDLSLDLQRVNLERSKLGSEIFRNISQGVGASINAISNILR